jgi:hypothetical protein
MGFISQKTTFFIVTTVKLQILQIVILCLKNCIFRLKYCQARWLVVGSWLRRYATSRKILISTTFCKTRTDKQRGQAILPLIYTPGYTLSPTMPRKSRSELRRPVSFGSRFLAAISVRSTFVWELIRDSWGAVTLSAPSLHPLLAGNTNGWLRENSDWVTEVRNQRAVKP